jgi:uncharacterized protein
MRGPGAGRVDLTGNEYISIPDVRADGALDGLNVLHAGLGGLVEWAGDGERPLLRPRIRVAGADVELAGLQWRRLDRWIPTFTTELPGRIAVTGTICAPGGYPPARGCVLRLEIENGGRAPVEVTVSLDVSWAASRLRIATARDLAGANRLAADAATGVVALETDGGRGPALAVCGARRADHVSSVSVGVAQDALADVEGRIELREENGRFLLATLSQTFTATPNRRTSTAFFIGAGRERDGAAGAAVSLRRTGADECVRQARLDLSYTLRSAQDHRWADLLNRNLIFNRYFATARGIDDDRLYLLRSRSPRCSEPALFNEREALFWTLPALILADPGTAREALFRALELFSERSGEYRRYLDGGAYDSAFSLDQFLLYAWALDHYASEGGDPGVVDEPLARQVMFETDATLFGRLHPEHMLCSTELLASGDAADHPYTTFGNSLVRWFCDALPRLLPPNGEEQPPRFSGGAAEVTAAVWQHCVADLDGAPIFASSSDLEGATAIYDDPAASLVLLPFLGFCTPDDPVWLSTMEFLRSPAYPLWRPGAVGGLAGRSRPDRASVAALCADLLAPDPAAALDRLLRLRLPGNLAAAAYDPDSGEAIDPDNAALAGFLAWSLVRAAELPASRKGRRGSR